MSRQNYSRWRKSNNPPFKQSRGTTDQPKKLIKSGTVNTGYEYEKHIPALFVLKLLLDRNVKGFSLELNSRSYDKFDDLILNIVYNNDQRESFAIQLKHREKPNDLLDAVQEFNRWDSNDKPKPFEISQYLNAYQAQPEDLQNECKFILYTNAQFQNIKNVPNYDVVSLENPFQTELFDVEGISQIKEKSQNRPFCKNFFFISGQKNDTEVKKEISDILEKQFHADSEAADSYLCFFQNLRGGCYDSNVISRDEIILNLSKLLLSKCTITTKIAPSRERKIELIEQAISMFDVIILEKTKKEYIEENWKFLSADVVDLAKKFKFLATNETMIEKINFHSLSYLHSHYLFVHVTENSKRMIVFLASLVRTLEEHHLNLILVGEGIKKEEFQEGNVFHSMSNLSGNLHDEIASTFKVSLQGREPTSLAVLHQKFSLKLDEFLTPDDMFQFLKGDYLVGQKMDELPDFHISRILMRSQVTLKELQMLSLHKKTIVNCGNNVSEFKKYLEAENLGSNIIFTDCVESVHKNSKPGLILVDEYQSLSKNDDSDFYQLKITPDNISRIQWLENEMRVEDPSIFENRLNIVYGISGIGKTTMMKCLVRKCPMDYWVVTVPVYQMGQIFKNKKLEDIWKYCLQPPHALNERFFEYLIREKKIIFLMDGLNELNNTLINSALKTIQQMLKEGHKVWIFSSESFKNTAESVLGLSCSYSINSLTVEEQKQYIQDKLKKAKIKQRTIDKIISKLSSTDQYKDIFKLPLILYILTENLIKRKPKNLEAVLTWNQMYSGFFDGQIEHYLNKSGCSCFTQLNHVVDGFKKFYFKVYQTAALQTCLEPSLFKKLKLDQTFIQEIKENGSFMQQIKKNGDCLGFIKVNADDTFTFTHYTFAEYFVATWLCENFDRISNKVKKFLFRSEYSGIRRFFDEQLAEDCPLHLAVLEQDVAKINQHIDNGLAKEDKGGRTPLHLVVSIGTTFPIINEEYVKNNNYKINPKISNKHKEILECFLKKDEGLDILKRDRVFSWNCFQYADASLCLFALEKLAEKEEIFWKYLSTYQHIFTLSYYSATMGFNNLLEVAITEKKMPSAKIQKRKKKKMSDFSKIEVPIIKKKMSHLSKIHNRKPLLHLALENGHAEIVFFLIKHEACVHQKDFLSKTPLHIVSSFYIPFQIEIAESLINKGASVKAEDVIGKTPLHFAARMNHNDVVELLIKKGGSVNALDKEKKSPLHKAAFMGQTDMVRYLIENGGEVNAKNNDWRGPLQRAVEMGHCETVKCLLENNADKNAFDKWQKTALHYAASEGHEDILKYLISQEVNIYARDEDEKTAKQIAIDKGHENIVEVLSEAESKSSPNSPLNPYENDFHNAAQSGDLELLKSMVLSGKEIEETNVNEETVLHVASSKGHLEMVTYLLSQGAKPSSTNKVGRVPLHLACHHGHLKVVEELLTRGQSHVQDIWGQTPLHRAAYKGHKDIVKLLIQHGREVNCKDNEEETPLHCAASGNWKNVVEYLISKSADTRLVTKKKETCLHLAAQNGCIEVVDYLVKNKRELMNEINFYERTALHLAAEKGNRKVAEILVRGGADVKKLDNLGQTAFDIAVKGKRSGTAQLLIEHHFL